MTAGQGASAGLFDDKGRSISEKREAAQNRLRASLARRGHEYHEYSSIYQSARFPRASERGWIRHLSAVEEPQKESGNEACALSGSKCGGQLLHARNFSEMHLMLPEFWDSCAG
ncbi:hypothetical protein WJX79_010079 [Trebouxia sp. C0005]